MQPKVNKPEPAEPAQDMYADVHLSDADDKALERMKKDLLGAFNGEKRALEQGGSISYERGIYMVSAATGFAAICTEQRERAMLRARQQHFLNQRAKP